MELNPIIKDPLARLDYSLEWTDWLAKAADTITASTWKVSSGLTVELQGHTDTVATIWLSGGTSGRCYTITNLITTAQGRQDERTTIVRIQAR